MTTNICPCDSGKLFSVCCGPLLMRQAHAKTPVQLMRSRYSAYALGGYGNYLFETWLPSSAIGLSPADLSLRSTTWLGLNILKKSQHGESGIVEFKATYLDESGQNAVHHEESIFKRVKGKWFYEGIKAD